MKCLIYARVSRDQRGESRSVSEQSNECQAWAEREGWTIDAIIAEQGSASRYARSTGARSRWDEVTAAVASGKYDALLTWESSRATRDLKDYTALRDVCAKHQVRWGYSGTLYDLDDRSDRFRTGLDALLSEDEAARTSERVRRAVRARAIAGTPHGKLPYGYRREYDLNTGALVRQVPDEETAPIVREIFARVARGETLGMIAADLTDRGVPTPRPARVRVDPGWIRTTLRRIACNPIYIGKRVHQGKVVGDATWPAIVDQTTYDKSLAILTAPNRPGLRPAGGRASKHMLSGIAKCGACTAPMYVLENRGILSYSCLTRKCFKVSRAEWKLDEYVLDYLIEMLAQSRDSLGADTEDINEELAALRARATELRERLDGFVEQAADGSLSASALAKIEARLLPQIRAADKAARVQVATDVLDGIDLDNPTAIRELGKDRLRVIVRALLDIRVDPVGRGKRTFDPASVRITPLW